MQSLVKRLSVYVLQLHLVGSFNLIGLQNSRKGRWYDAREWAAMLHDRGAEIAEDMERLERNECSMLRWISNVRVYTQQKVRSLRERLDMRERVLIYARVIKFN